MPNFLLALWQRLTVRSVQANAEVEQIAVLQQMAARRRAEYAEEKERAALAGEASPSPLLSTRRKQVAEAEAAHVAALQAWENAQSRQKSR